MEAPRKHHHHRHPDPHKPSADLSHFYVVTPITNSARYKRRYELYWRFAEMIESTGVKLITVEQAFGHRPFMVTEPGNPYHIQVRSHEELWLKENMINIGIQHILRLDPDAREVAWIDADCFPMIPCIEWLEEIWHALQHYEFVQCWEWLLNLGPQNEPLTGKPESSFMATYRKYGFQVPPKKQKRSDNGYNYSSFGHTGLAWAANVDAISKVGGLLDVCILGSGDWHMAHALVGMVREWSGEFSQLHEYQKYILEWENRCERWIKRDVGMVPVTMGHWFHGDFINRGYGTRGQITIENEYNPHTDIKKDCHGLYQLETWEPRQIRMRDLIRAYFSARHEDSIDVLNKKR